MKTVLPRGSSRMVRPRQAAHGRTPTTLALTCTFALSIALLFGNSGCHPATASHSDDGQLSNRERQLVTESREHLHRLTASTEFPIDSVRWNFVESPTIDRVDWPDFETSDVYMINQSVFANLTFPGNCLFEGQVESIQVTRDGQIQNKISLISLDYKIRGEALAREIQRLDQLYHLHSRYNTAQDWLTEETYQDYQSQSHGDYPVVSLLVKRNPGQDGRHYIFVTFSDIRCPMSSLAQEAFNRIDAGDSDWALAALDRGLATELDETDVDGESLLNRAAETGSLPLVKALLDAGAAVDGPNLAVLSPLGRAVVEGHDEVAELLLAHGANIDRRAPGGQTALLEAASTNFHVRPNHETVSWLLSHGAKPDIPDSTGWSAIDYARRHNFKQVVDLLVKAQQHLPSIH